MAIYVRFKNGSGEKYLTNRAELERLKERGEKIEVITTGRSKNPLKTPKRSYKKSMSIFDSSAGWL